MEKSKCILHTGCKHKTGYGLIGRWINGKPKTFYAHRWAYKEEYGEIPKGAHVLHSCDNKLCINLEHLSLGDNSRNQLEAYQRGLKPKNLKIPYKSHDSIFSRRKLGETFQSIADDYNVTESGIRCLFKRKDWDSSIDNGV